MFAWDLSLAFEMTAEIPHMRSEWQSYHSEQNAVMWRISYKRKLSIITVANKNKRFFVYTRNNIWLSCWAAVKHLKLKHMSFWKALPWRISRKSYYHSEHSISGVKNIRPDVCCVRSLTYARNGTTVILTTAGRKNLLQTPLSFWMQRKRNEESHAKKVRAKWRILTYRE